MMNVCCGEAGLCFLLNALHLISNRQGLSDGWMDGRTGEEECGVNEEKSRGDFIMKCLLALIRMIYTALCV